MAKAQREGGLYYTDKGVAVDAEGKKLEDAPKQPKDTDPSKQPGAAGASTSEERLGIAIATALKGGKATSTKDSDTDDDALPPIKDLADHVAGLDKAEVKAMAKRDERVSAEPIYKARLAELEAE